MALVEQTSFTCIKNDSQIIKNVHIRPKTPKGQVSNYTLSMKNKSNNVPLSLTVTFIYKPQCCLSMTQTNTKAHFIGIQVMY